MPTQRSGPAFYGGLALVTGATLALEIIQTRMLSVVSWYHLAFFVISVAMFGMTAGALHVFVRPQRFVPERLGETLARYSVLTAASTGLAYLDQVCLAPEMVLSASALVVFARLALTVSVPFFFSGVVVTLALTRSPYPVGRTYGADLLGAALGCVAVIPLLSALSGPGAVFAVGAVMALGALCFARWGDSRKWARRGAFAFCVLGTVALAHAFTRHGLDPIVVKGLAEKRHLMAYVRWNSFSRVVANAPSVARPADALWAASPNVPPRSVEIVRMTIDGSAGTNIFPMRGDPRNVEFLRYDATSMAYAIRRGSVAVIGVGGGKDLMTALVFGNERVLGIELNPALSGALQGPYRDFAGLAGHPRVRLVTDEARSYLARSRESFDVLQASLIDTWASTGAGAFSLSENSLYTVEAWQVFLSRLRPNGVFTVSRWYAPDRIDETARLLSLAAAALFRAGVEHPERHVMLGAHARVATLLLSREPFAADDVAALSHYCEEMGFSVVLAPGRPPASPTLRQILAADGEPALFALGRRAPLDLTPPTDARPFFFNLLRLSRPWKIAGYLGQSSGVITGNLMATVTLLAILAVTLGLGLATLLIPWRMAPPGVALPSGGALAYFALIGCGFMFVEIAFLQRLSVYLGHPVYSLAVVLFSLILFTGLGSFVSERWPLSSTRAFALFLGALVGYVVAAAALLPRLTGAFESASLPGRAALSVAVLAPAGLMMGQMFPNGMRLAEPGSTPWLWAVNGAAGVVASALAVATSIAFGIDTTMYLGAGCYALILAVVASMPGITSSGARGPASARG